MGASFQMIKNTSSLWVFGYGSLCWNPGFDYKCTSIGYIHGYSRRFWQGNTTHRGIPGQPGRVATLVEEKDSRSYGVAYELIGDEALKYLEMREVTLGGYATRFTTFYPSHSNEPFPVLLYIATPINQLWLGPASESEIAEQVIHSTGNTGHNVEKTYSASIG
ncbi:CHAC [Lepeophtheirus salmonis]|uniref:glutathione-specific gamma-glutamylcyclotransferase n=1 Tax=Lepeophtheirus salmonis TaxID=72036 RepID=A0A7R8D6M0_LEPSM|nr:CHAC [Lepeophtheirus salmonis]CAF3046383.1 CHAC [Lepeophtheirus salmonis]